MGKVGRLTLRAFFITLLFLLQGCGGGGASSVLLGSSNPELSPLADRQVDPPPPDQQLLDDLTSALETQLAEMGKDISAVVMKAPSCGCEVIDLRGEILDPDSSGQLPPYGVSLRWTEQLIGDYDMSGEVNISDITPLALFFGYDVIYVDPEIAGEGPRLPEGNPDDFGAVEPGMPPAADSGAFNWRLARIDGNHDGEINIGDLTPLAVHWGEVITGYNVYRKGPAEGDFTLVESGLVPTRPSTLSRVDVMDPERPYSKQVVPLYAHPDFFMLDQPDPNSEYSYFVAPYNSHVKEEGPCCETVGIFPFTDDTINDGIIPDLQASLLSEGEIYMDAGLPVIQAVLPASVRLDASGSYVPGDMTANYVWDFDGDGIYDLSSDENPIVEHVYQANARLHTSVRVVGVNADHGTSRTTSGISRQTSAIGDSQSTSVDLVIMSPDGNLPPTAIVAADSTLGRAPLQVQFSGALSSDGDGTVDVFDWDFDGDGSSDYSSTSPSATYTYGQPGHYELTLTVVDDQGGYDTAVMSVIVSDEDGHWPPSASLIVFPTTGAAPLDVTLNAKHSADPDGQLVSYEWDLDGDFAFDINSGTQSELEYTFPNSGVYNVWLRVTDSDGQFDLDRALITVNTQPFGGLEASPTEGPGPLTVEFDASSSQDLDGTIVKYEWDFESDGEYDLDTGILPRTTHTYYTIGEMLCTVKLTDNLGAIATQSTSVNVIEPITNLTPLATLDADVTSGPPPLAVTFTADGTDPDEDGGIDHFDWDYQGDGIIDEQTIFLLKTREHVYAQAGRYLATVRVVDVLGGVAAAELEIVVGDGSNDPPVASFAYDPIGAAPDEVITFDAAASMDDGFIAEYAWDFNADGTFDVSGDAAEAATATHSYSALGSYRVLLRVTDNDGAVAYAYNDIVVGKVPKLTVLAETDYAEVPNAEFCLDASRSTGEEGNITLFEWDLNGDGQFEIQTGVSPFITATYDIDDLQTYPGGVVTPRLRATNEIGAMAETSVIYMPARDENGQPLRDEFGNLVLGEDGLPLKEEVELRLFDDYDEIEDNDNLQITNRLVGPGTNGAFDPTPGGDRIVAVQKRAFVGDPIPVTRTDPLLGGPYVAGSLGERLLARIYDGDDEDWYSFKLSDGAHVEIAMHLEGIDVTDFILRLYDSDGSAVLAQSDLPGNEQISYDFRDPGIYYIRVNRFVGPGQDYKLSLVSTPLYYFPEGVVDNVNDSPAEADSLHDPGGGSGLIPIIWGRVDPNADPVDWYYFDYGSSVTTRVYLSFAHLIGDLDLFLYDQNLSLLGYANSSDDDEVLWRQLPDPAGTARVYVKVAIYGGNAANYTMTVGYPAGAPENVGATRGTANGKITITWDPPTGGNVPNGYKVYVADAEDGYYSLLATLTNPNNHWYVHDLSATEDLPLHNEVFWYKVVSTRTGELDSDPSEPVDGYVNDVLPAMGLTASDFDYTTKVIISFYDSPHDPDLGTGKFGVPPAYYNVYADPVGSRPNTLIASFYPGQGTETAVPAMGGIPDRDGEIFCFEWTGGPDWDAPELRGLDISFTVTAQAPRLLYSSPATPVEFGGINVEPTMNTPSITVTNGLFVDQVRINWLDDFLTSGKPQPDNYVLQFQGEYDWGWTTVGGAPIDAVESQTQYELWLPNASGIGAPPSGKYRVRSYSQIWGYSGWSNLDFGYASDNTLQEPSYGPDGLGADQSNWWVEKHTDHNSPGGDPPPHWHVHVDLGSPDPATIVPLVWRYRFKRGGMDWTSWSWQFAFDREQVTRTTYPQEWVYLTYPNADDRWVEIEVAWQDPTDWTKTLTAVHSIKKTSNLAGLER